MKDIRLAEKTLFGNKLVSSLTAWEEAHLSGSVFRLRLYPNGFFVYPVVPPARKVIPNNHDRILEEFGIRPERPWSVWRSRAPTPARCTTSCPASC